VDPSRRPDAVPARKVFAGEAENPPISDVRIFEAARSGLEKFAFAQKL
jgi:hypothetical protein